MVLVVTEKTSGTRKSTQNLCHVVAKVLVERPVDAGNVNYTAPVCTATVRVECHVSSENFELDSKTCSEHLRILI